MKTKIEIEFEDFDVPEIITELNPLPVHAPVRQYHISELPGTVLDDMCERFRRAVFEKAGLPYVPKSRRLFCGVAESYKGGMWISPDLEEPKDGEVYQVFNGMRRIAKYNAKLGWYTEDGCLSIDNVLYYTLAAPVPEEYKR
jgi:hypothetical protein